jgi:hypothetical protein
MADNTTPTAPREPGLYERHTQTILMAVATAAIIGCFTFLWNLNETVTEIRGDNSKRSLMIDQVQKSVNDLRLDMNTTKLGVQDVRERMIRVEIETQKDK